MHAEISEAVRRKAMEEIQASVRGNGELGEAETKTVLAGLDAVLERQTLDDIDEHMEGLAGSDFDLFEKIEPYARRYFRSLLRTFSPDANSVPAAPELSL